MPGSQYSAKVIVALDSRKIDHYVSFVDWNPKTRTLPSGNKMVPELLVEYNDDDGKEPMILADSDAILQWFDKTLDTKFFPSDEIREWTRRASDGFLAGAVLYYNWVHPVGYQRTKQKAIAQWTLPSMMPSFLGMPLIDWYSSADRKRFESKAAAMMNLTGEILKPKEIRTKLIDELKAFQNLLSSPDNNEKEDSKYLMMTGSQEPTALDFSVYVMIERLVGKSMGDIPLDASIPEFRVETSEELAALWRWYDAMRQNHPIRFKGKRPPRL